MIVGVFVVRRFIAKKNGVKNSITRVPSNVKQFESKAYTRFGDVKKACGAIGFRYNLSRWRARRTFPSVATP